MEVGESILDLIKRILGITRSTMRSRFAEFCLTMSATIPVTKSPLLETYPEAATVRRLSCGVSQLNYSQTSFASTCFKPATAKRRVRDIFIPSTMLEWICGISQCA